MANELELDVLPGPKDNSWENYYSNKGLFPFDHLSLDKVNKLIVKDFEHDYWFLMYLNKEEGRLFNGGEYHSNITPELKKLEGLMSFEDAFRIFKEKEIDDKNERLVLIYNNPYIEDYEEDDDYWELGLNNDAFGYIILSKGNDELDTDTLREDLELDVLDTKPTVQQKGPYEYVIRYARDLNGIEEVERIIEHPIRMKFVNFDYEDDMVKVIIRPEYHNTYLRYIVNYPDAYGMMRAINPVSVPNPHWYDWAPEDESEEDKAWTKESIEKAKKLDDLFGLDVSTRWLKEVGPIREDIDLDISEDNINHEYLVNNDCVDFIQKHKDERQWVVGFYEPSGIGTEYVSTHVTFDEAYRIFNNCVPRNNLHVMVAYMKQFEGKVVLRKPNEYKEDLDLDVVDTRAIATDRQGRYGFIRYEIIDPEIKEEIIANMGGSAHWREKVKRYLEEPYVWDLMFWNHPSSHQGYINIWKDETRRERVVGTYEDGPRPDAHIIDKILNRALHEKIVKKGSKWQVQSENGRNLGTYDTKGEAEDRLQQVHYFKHKNEELDTASDLNIENVKPSHRYPRGYEIISHTLKQDLYMGHVNGYVSYGWRKEYTDDMEKELNTYVDGEMHLYCEPDEEEGDTWFIDMYRPNQEHVSVYAQVPVDIAQDIINNKVDEEKILSLWNKRVTEDLEVSSDLNIHNVEEDGRDSYIIKSYTLKEMILDKYMQSVIKNNYKDDDKYAQMIESILSPLIEEGLWILEKIQTIDYDEQWVVEATLDDTGFRIHLTSKEAEDIINDNVKELLEDFDVIDISDQGGTYETNDQEYYILHVQQAQVFIDSIKPYVESTQSDYEVLFLKDFIEHMTEENLEEGFVTVELCKEHGNVYVILWDDADSCEFSISEEDYKKYKLDEVVKLEDIPTYALDEDLELDPVEWKDSDMKYSEIRASDFRVIGERYILTGSRKDLLFNLLSQEGDAATIEEYFTSPRYTVEVTGYTHPHTPEMKPNYYVRFIDNNTHLHVTGFGLFGLSISKEIFDAVTSPEIEEELELDVLDNDHSEWKEYAFPFSAAYTIDDYEEVILSRGNNNNEWCLSLHRAADEEYYNGNVDEMPEDLDELNGFFDFETAFKKFKDAKLMPGDELLLDYFPEDFNDPDYGDMSVLYRKGPEITEDFDVVDVPKVIDNPNEITDRKVKEAIIDALKQSGASEDTIYGLESHIRNRWEIYTYEYDDGGLPYILIYTRNNKFLGRVGISREAFEIVQDMIKDDLDEYLTDEIELEIADDKYKHLDYKQYLYNDGKNNPEEHIQLEGGDICWSLQVTDVDGNIWAGYFDELPSGYNEYQDFENGYSLFREYQPSPREFSIDLVCTSNLDTDDQETVTVLRREFENVDESIKEVAEDFEVQTNVLDPFLTEISASDIIENLESNFNIYIIPDGSINIVLSNEGIGRDLENAIFDYTEDYCLVLRPSTDSLFTNLNHVFIELPKNGKNLTQGQIKFLRDNIDILKDNDDYKVSLNVGWTDDIEEFLDYKTAPQPEEIDEELEEIVNSTDNYKLIKLNNGEGVVVQFKSDDIKQIVKDICNNDVELGFGLRQEIRHTPENLWLRYGYCRIYDDRSDFATLMTPHTSENKIADCENKVDMILANVLSKQDYNYVINSEAYKDAFGDDEEVAEDLDLEVTNDKPELVSETHTSNSYKLSDILAKQLIEMVYAIDSDKDKYDSRLHAIENSPNDIKLIVWHYDDDMEYDLRIGSLMLILTAFDIDALNSKSSYYDPVSVEIGEEIDKLLGFTFTSEWRNREIQEDIELDVEDGDPLLGYIDDDCKLTTNLIGKDIINTKTGKRGWIQSYSPRVLFVRWRGNERASKILTAYPDKLAKYIIVPHLDEDLDLDVMDIPDYKHNYDIHVNYGGPLNPDEVIAEYFGEPVWTLTVESNNTLNVIARGWEDDLPEGFNGWFTFAEGYQKLLEYKNTFKFYKSISVHLCCKYTSNEYQGIYSVLFRYIDNRDLEEILKEDFEYDLISERSWVIDDESSDIDGVYYLGTEAKDYILSHLNEILDIDGSSNFIDVPPSAEGREEVFNDVKHQLEELYGDTWIYGSDKMKTKRFSSLAGYLMVNNFKGRLFPDKIEPYLETVAEKRSMKDAAGITEDMGVDVVSNLDISDTSVVDDKNIETLVRFLEDCGDEVVVIDNIVFEGQPLGVKDDIGDWKTIFDCAFECRDGLVTVYYGIPFGTDDDEAKLWDSIKDNTLDIKEWKEKYSHAADSLTEVTLEEVMSYLAELWGWSQEEMNQYLD